MNKKLPPTTKRVAYHTCNKTNKIIRDKAIDCIDTYKDSDESILSDKIEKLNHEWDTERVLETNAASAVILGSLIGYKKNKSCLFLMTGAVGLFLLQHALQGWCPPLPIIRKMGVRTAEEINNEKIVLKKIRGDFLEDSDDAESLLEMAEE